MPRIPTLVTNLARALGSRRQAFAELRWIKAAVGQHHPSSSLLADKLLKRARGWPLQYLLGGRRFVPSWQYPFMVGFIGSQPFGSLEILTRPPTLIPRPETEYWTLRLAQILRGHASEDTPLRVLDLCTGTACIPLLLCESLPPRTISALAIDVSPAAVELAHENILRCGFNDPSGNTVHVEQLDIFATDFAQLLEQHNSARQPFDVLTANPPYIPREQYDKLSHTVRAFEDPLALLGEVPSTLADKPGYHPDYDRLGLSFYVHIATLVQHQNLVRRGGHVVLEVGAGQARAVERMFLPFVQQTNIWTDPWGIERVVYARL